MKIQLKRRQDHAVATWAGGATTELYISPSTASCPERNFAFRISSATVELPESTFSDFSGFTRHIMPLEGSMELWHDEKFAASLAPYEGHTFDGSRQTRSLGTCVDFNLIHIPALHGGLYAVRTAQTLTPTTGYTGIYARCDGLVVTGDAFTHTLSCGDFLLLECETDEAPGAVHLKAPSQKTEVLAVVTTVRTVCY